VKKKSATRFCACIRARFHIGNERLDFLECIRIELIMNPPSILPVANDSGVFENAEMERQTGLRGIERIGKLADTPFPFAEQLDDLEPGLVGEGVKELDRAVGP
jgi:hypothetical protein